MPEINSSSCLFTFCLILWVVWLGVGGIRTVRKLQSKDCLVKSAEMFLTIVICGKLLPFSDKSSKCLSPRSSTRIPSCLISPSCLLQSKTCPWPSWEQAGDGHAMEVMMVVDSSKATKIKVEVPSRN